MPLSQYLRPRLLQISNPGEPSPDWQQGYGFQFWMSRHGYRGDGAFGQFCVILPEQETVIVTTACTVDMQAVLDAMWTHLLPGLGTVSPGSGSAQDQLSARLAGLELPACPAAPAPADWAPWTSGPFNIAASTAGTPGSACPDLHRGSTGGRRLADQPQRACQRADLARRYRSLDRI